MTEINYLKLAERVKAMQDWRFIPTTDIAKQLGQPERQMQLYMNHMQKLGLLPAKSPIQGRTYRNYQKIQRYLEKHPGKIYLSVMAEAITGFRCSGANLDCFRNAITLAKAEGLQLEYHRIEDGPRPRSPKPVECKSKISDGKPRFISLAEVDPEHLQRFVALHQFIGGRHAV